MSSTELMASSEINIFNSESKQIGSVSVRAEMTAAEFWEQVRYSVKHETSLFSSVQFSAPLALPAALPWHRRTTTVVSLGSIGAFIWANASSVPALNFRGIGSEAQELLHEWSTGQTTVHCTA